MTGNKPFLRITMIITALLLGPISTLFFSVKLVGLKVADNFVRY
jgi:hypothetical protein